MANNSFLYKIYDDLVNAVKKTGKPVYLDRPKTLNSETTQFVVVSLPAQIYGMVKGGLGFRSGSNGLISVFCKAKNDSTLNINAQSILVQQVLDLFPIAGKAVEASNPAILMQGYDGFGYQVTQITFKLRTIKS